tara:strand:+ start:226 stop:474 length:249 start_codon:yes stop_codon:yes gene_type:complete
MNKLNLEKVNSKKQLEAQGYCTIELNKGRWDYFEGEPDMPKYVLVSRGHYTFNNGGDNNLMTSPCNSIKEALNIYNNGINKD